MSSYHSQASLPLPSDDQIEHSAQLVSRIISNIESSGGVISFRDYMQHCLYEPGLGYYAAGSTKFGEAGDFVTAPEISCLFGGCIANQIKDMLDQGLMSNILEIGAGTGKLCVDIIQQLKKVQIEFNSYLILETSSDLRQRQQDLLKENLTEDDFNKIQWLDSLPEGFCGLVLGNEVLDAMPVNVVLKQQSWLELGVGYSEEKFVWQAIDSESEAVGQIKTIDSQNTLPEQYCTEVNLNYVPWCQSLFDSCDKAVVLMIDYGYLQAQYYDDFRVSGTLSCFYQHRIHADPFVYPGLQDITAFVDFDAFADAALMAGFEIKGLSSQANFLMQNGLLDLSEPEADEMKQLAFSQQMQTLTLPGEMGEKFKVIGLQKNIEINISGL